MTIKDLKEKSADELRVVLAEQREHLRTLRFKVHADEHRQIRDLRVARITIARIMTLLNQKPS